VISSEDNDFYAICPRPFPPLTRGKLDGNAFEVS
jgi:hypothetical protein